jgi:Ran GTPase-activating protein (RanGAP) involved in mRNA processing and transport
MHSNDLAKCIRTLGGGLKTLNLAKNRLGDEGLQLVVKALCESQVEAVSLEGNKITERSVEMVVGALKTNKTLKLLDLSGNGIQSRLMKNKLKNGLT